MTQQQEHLGLRMVTVESGPFGCKTEMANYLQDDGAKIIPKSTVSSFAGFARLEPCPHRQLQSTAAVFFSTLHPLRVKK